MAESNIPATPWNQPTPEEFKNPGPNLDAILHDFFAFLRRVALVALVKTADLTPTEQFALCWASGVPIEFKDGKFTTSVKCSVVRIDDHWKVFQGAPSLDADQSNSLEKPEFGGVKEKIL